MRSARHGAAAASAAVIVALPVAGAAVGSLEADTGTPPPDPGTTTSPTVDPQVYELERENRRLRRLAYHLKLNVRNLRYTLLRRPSVAEAINLAGATYGQTTTLWRKARCESQLNRWAHNPSGAAGLFQFLPSTWASTPYAGFSIYSAEANAMAAGWMHSHGRGGEWVCR